ncbi:MAG: hypothetical protein IPP71_12945 [Bacteroidetes bacterium]|nr:hypothetical protein [Bacteroidota bacterium]
MYFLSFEDNSDFMRPLYFLFVLVFSSIPAVLNGQMNYAVSFPNPNTHYIQVEATISGVLSDSIDIKMPVWIRAPIWFVNFREM